MQVRVGVDVAKATIDYAADDGSRGQVANTATALKQWLGRWPSGMVRVLAVESTGGYYELLATLAQTAGWTVHVVNPAHVKQFRQYSGVRSKTDRVDAELVLQYLCEKGATLRVWLPASKVQRALLKLIRERAGVVKHLGALLQGVTDKQLVAQLRACQQSCLAHLDARIEALIRSDEALTRARKQLASVPGIGPLTSAALALLFCRVPFRTSDAAVAFVGLDLRANDSGQKVGRRFLTKKGDPEYRRLLYMAGSAAAKSKLMRPLYQALKARHGTTAAIVILARKLLRIALSVYRSGAAFDPTKLGIAPKVA